MKWNKFPNKKPKMGQEVLVFCDGYSVHDKYWCDYYLAIFVKNPYDRRRWAFAQSVDIRVGSDHPWLYDRVKYWMELPEKPEPSQRTI